MQVLIDSFLMYVLWMKLLWCHKDIFSRFICKHAKKLKFTWKPRIVSFPADDWQRYFFCYESHVIGWMLIQKEGERDKEGTT